MVKTVVSCDVCGRDKKETNNWLIAIIPADDADGRIGIAFGPSEAVIDNEDGFLTIKNICGQECLHKCLSHWLESRKHITPTNIQESETK